MATRTRMASKRERTRVALLAAAQQLMTEKGVDATSLLEITDGTDVAAGTFYNYFTSKEDIASQVLDCVIENLAQRHDAALRTLAPLTPLEMIAVSARCAIRELLTNPIWHWWLQRPELLAERMRAGFGRLGLRDLARAKSDGTVFPPRGDLDTAWSVMVWTLVGGARDIMFGRQGKGTETILTQTVMQALGVAPAEAVRLCRRRLPTYPELPIDFAFTFEGKSDAA